MRYALTCRLQRLAAQAPARRALALAPTPEAEVVTVAYVHALLAQYEPLLTAVESTDWYIAPLE